MADEQLIPLRVADVRVAVPAGNGVEAGLIVLEEEGEPYRQLRMYVGQPEARAIQVAWSNNVPLRPSTWDLFVTTVSLLDARIARVVLTDVEEGRHYFARLELERETVGAPLVMTARPSDAIALALRAYRAGIVARAVVLDSAGVMADGTPWVAPPPAQIGAGPLDQAPIRVGAPGTSAGPGLPGGPVGGGGPVLAGAEVDRGQPGLVTGAALGAGLGAVAGTVGGGTTAAETHGRAVGSAGAGSHDGDPSVAGSPHRGTGDTGQEPEDDDEDAPMVDAGPAWSHLEPAPESKKKQKAKKKAKKKKG